MSYYWRFDGEIFLDPPLTVEQRLELKAIIDEELYAQGEELDSISEDGSILDPCCCGDYNVEINHLPSEMEKYVFPFLKERGIKYSGEGTWCNDEWESGEWEIVNGEYELIKYKDLVDKLRLKIMKLEECG